MKKIVAFLFVGLMISLSGCGDKKESKKPEKITIQNNTKKETETPKADENKSSGDVALIAKGKKLFKDKTCFTCHQPKTKVIGPAITEITKVYKEKDANIIAFLKGNMEAIVDTDPAQVAIMKANLDGFVKDLTDEELKALEAYMLSVN